MSSYLWQYFFEDDVENFREVLANATYSTSAATSKSSRGTPTAVTGSPGANVSTSPSITIKGKRTRGGHSSDLGLSRTDLNWRDGNGVTLLHYIAASARPTASRFAYALCQVPLVDLYIQDAESGWTALHRALYFGNVTIARMFMDRDLQDTTAYGYAGTHIGNGGLIKIKDHEGKSPFDVYGASIASRSVHDEVSIPLLSTSSDDDDNENAQGISGDREDENVRSKDIAPRTNVEGDEMYAFGSNKNLTLGFGDEDDRHFPEKIALKRPEHLLRRLKAEHLISLGRAASLARSSELPSSLPALVSHRPIIIQDVQLSKFHSAVLTTDPEANLYMCGFGKGGRLGTGDEATRFSYVPIFGGGLIGERIIHIALGQDHSLAISSQGEVYAWGSNALGQLGFAPAGLGSQDEKPTQLLPRQIFGQLKRELIVGGAASRIHSVVYTPTSLYTFGKNDGQLGIVDSDARSLTVQSAPRKVAASLFTSTILAVSAIDRATVCLLDNHEVWVLANFGYTKLSFPVEGFSNYFLQDTASSSRCGKPPSEVCKITSGGDTICALSSSGDVFIVHVSQNAGAGPTSTSTTNPGKIPRALSAPQRVWSMERGHMAVTDAGVGQDGSIIICTDSGSVWRRVKRTKIKDTSANNLAGYKSKDYKFSRVPGLTRIAAVRSNIFGAFAAVRKDCNVLHNEIGVDSPSLWKQVFPLLPLQCLSVKEEPGMEDPAPRFWVSTPPAHDTATIRRAVIQTPDIEAKLSSLLQDLEHSSSMGYDLRIGTTVSEVVLPIHEFIVAGRSEILRRALSDFRHNYYFAVSDIMTIQYDSDGKALVQFQGVDFLTVLNFVLYLYTDTVVDVWHYTRDALSLAYRYRQVRIELMKISAALDLQRLEHAVRHMVEPPKTLHIDFDFAIQDPRFYESADIEVELEGQNVKLHQALVCQRCPFFQGLFNGRAAGAWLRSRREDSQQELTKVDLKHISPAIFQLVVRHLYADTDEAIFDHIITEDVDSFLDVIMDVMSVANELMLDRLTQCCQRLLGRYINTRNVCQFLNAVSPCSITEFKNAALEYVCLNLEGILENHLLGELDDDLMLELDEVVRQNQKACLPFAKSGRAEAELFGRYPQLADIIERGRRAKIDSFRLPSRLRDDENYYASTGRIRRSSRGYQNSPTIFRGATPHGAEQDTNFKGNLKPQRSAPDLMFSMEEEEEDQASATTVEASTPSYGDTQAVQADMLRTVSRGLAGAQIGTSPNTASSVGTLDHLTQGGSWTLEDTTKLYIKPAASSEVWGPSALNPSKLDMKEIMAQASSNQVSSLSSGLKSKAPLARITNSSQPARLSQKERKKQQQQQQQLEQVQDDDYYVQRSTIEETKQNSTAKPSPWRQTSTGRKVSLQDVLKAEGSRPPSSTPERLPRQASNPPLTMRQTVPGNASSARRSTSGGSPSLATPPAQRSTSNPVIPTTGTPSKPPSIAREVSSPAIRSIRHAPPPVEPSLQLSMADILAQQQTEKDVIKDAVAKRSLQEIQEEQAFQEWWDQESRKVKEEEEQRSKVASTSRGRSNTRGPRRGRGKGSGKEADAERGGGKVEGTQARSSGGRGRGGQSKEKARGN